ncbi:MAG: tRNA (adenine(22)-N(1))-methyltransferase TrmK [Butyrivibrio sp.]|nr:tRNA (adenine(22)-N(1))-methyltransferase TrmK [Butyrivibrio sp.]
MNRSGIDTDQREIQELNRSTGRHLSKRLETVLSMAEDAAQAHGGSFACAADIGCDHGYTAIELIRRGIAEHAIAADVRPGPLVRAKQHIAESGYNEKIDARCGSGLSILKPGEAGIVLLTGMGGRLIRRLLTEDDPVALGVTDLLLGPQSELWEMRIFLRERGLQIVDEQMLSEDGKDYHLMRVVVRPERSIWTDAAADPVMERLRDRFGLHLLKRCDPGLICSMKRRLELLEELLTKIPDGSERAAQYMAEKADILSALVMTNNKGERPMIQLTVNQKEYEYPEGTLFEKIAGDFQDSVSAPISGVVHNGKIKELIKPVDESGTLSFITIADNIGSKTYVRSATMMLVKAVRDIAEERHIRLSAKVEFTIGAAYYITIHGPVTVDAALAADLEQRMRDMTNAALPITKKTLAKEKAIALFREQGMEDKVRLFRYRRSSEVNVYTLDGYHDYYYGHMLSNTSQVKVFHVEHYREGILLHLPSKQAPEKLAEFIPREKLCDTMCSSAEWGHKMGIDCVGDLNDIVCSGGITDMILVQEALQERRIGAIAQQIHDRKGIKFVMIAGPSSSGKTSFAHRLSIQMRTYGINPHLISLDDYFKNREDTPLNADGSYNYECLGAIDVEGFNRDMVQLLKGERVEMPRFNFISGRREAHGDYLQLGEDDVLVIEGIHGLNEEMSHALPAESKFRIYISALTTLNIDDHNRIPTTDGRLLRRIVRDARTRGNSARKTISMWPSVRAGEEENIFPFQESADVMFNSAELYELSVIKQYAEPLLFAIGKEDPEYHEAKRLLKFLDYFVGVDAQALPHNSICREFVGGSCFRV